jgi:hypothetical protein
VQGMHFTEGATDPPIEPRVHSARFVQPADGSGQSLVGCLGGHIESPIQASSE